MSNNLSTALDLIRQDLNVIADQIKADPKITEAVKLLAGLNALEDVDGQPRTTLADILNLGSGSTAGMRASGVTRPDEYYGLEPLEAAKRVLRKLGRSANMAEIMSGIKSGGGETGSEDTLRLSLARSTVEIAKIGDDLFGLLEFFPHIKRGRPGRKKKNGAKEDGSPADTTADPETPDSSDTDEAEAV
jgi:hypothetical protein